MARLIPCLGLAVICAAGYGAFPQDRTDRTDRIQELISSLDGLPGSFSESDFLDRPALQELVALHSAATDQLEEALKSNSSWSVRASAAYILGETRHLQTLTSSYADDNPVVRAFVTQALYKNHIASVVVSENGSVVRKSIDFRMEYVEEAIATVAGERIVLQGPYLQMRLARLYEDLGKRVKKDPALNPPPSIPRPDPLGESTVEKPPETIEAAFILGNISRDNARQAISDVISRARSSTSLPLQTDLLNVIHSYLRRSKDLFSPAEEEMYARELWDIVEGSLRQMGSTELRYEAFIVLEKISPHDPARARRLANEILEREPQGIVRNAATAFLRRKPVEKKPYRLLGSSDASTGRKPAVADAKSPSSSGPSHASTSREESASKAGEGPGGPRDEEGSGSLPISVLFGCVILGILALIVWRAIRARG